jgi:hypothetical protein
VCVCVCVCGEGGGLKVRQGSEDIERGVLCVCGVGD